MREISDTETYLIKQDLMEFLSDEAKAFVRACEEGGYNKGEAEKIESIRKAFNEQIEALREELRHIQPESPDPGSRTNVGFIN